MIFVYWYYETHPEPRTPLNSSITISTILLKNRVPSEKNMQSVHNYKHNYSDPNTDNYHPENFGSQKKEKERPCCEKSGEP